MPVSVPIGSSHPSLRRMAPSRSYGEGSLRSISLCLCAWTRAEASNIHKTFYSSNCKEEPKRSLTVNPKGKDQTNQTPIVPHRGRPAPISGPAAAAVQGAVRRGSIPQSPSRRSRWPREQQNKTSAVKPAINENKQKPTQKTKGKGKTKPKTPPGPKRHPRERNHGASNAPAAGTAAARV